MTEDATASSLGFRVGVLTLLAGVLWAIGGVVGLAIAAIVGVVWTFVETPYAVAVGTLLYAVGITETEAAGLVGAVSFGVLFVPELFGRWRSKTASVATVVLFAMAAVLATSALTESVGLAAGIACLGYAVVAYGIHRYESVRLGMVTSGR